LALKFSFGSDVNIVIQHIRGPCEHGNGSSGPHEARRFLEKGSTVRKFIFAFYEVQIAVSGMHFFMFLLLSLEGTKSPLALLSLKVIYTILSNSLPIEEKIPCLRYKDE
jgi:hypothetical protein